MTPRPSSTPRSTGSGLPGESVSHALSHTLNEKMSSQALVAAMMGARSSVSTTVRAARREDGSPFAGKSLTVIEKAQARSVAFQMGTNTKKHESDVHPHVYAEHPE